MKKTSIVLITSALCIALACTKKETDTTAPVITISSPTTNQMFNAGDSVTVSFTVTDEDLHGYDYAIIKTATNDTIVDADIDTHANANVTEKFELTDAATQYKLVVGAEDHTGNTSSKSVNFHTM
jgi:hypothetical protein